MTPVTVEKVQKLKMFPTTEGSVTVKAMKSGTISISFFDEESSLLTTVKLTINTLKYSIVDCPAAAFTQEQVLKNDSSFWNEGNSDIWRVSQENKNICVYLNSNSVLRLSYEIKCDINDGHFAYFVIDHSDTSTVAVLDGKGMFVYQCILLV